MDAAEYKHLALGLIFLIYISESFEEQYQQLVAQKLKVQTPKTETNTWQIKYFLFLLRLVGLNIQRRTTQPTNGQDIDDAMDALTTNTSGEGDIRKSLVEKSLVDCIVNLPTKLFLNTQIPACLWFL